MTSVYITIDTEYSHALAASPRPVSRAENFARSISCHTPGGPVGLGYKLELFRRHGLKAVFFVDPMPALLWGVEAVTDVVRPIVEAGQDVQLHLHTEWLALTGVRNPLGADRTGRNIADFAFEDQCELLHWGRETLVRAGAKAPIAFRAGNYGASDETLRALGAIGMRYDSSHTPGIAARECTIGLGAQDRRPVHRLGIVEVPIGCIAASGDGLRHAQVCALSASEMLNAIAHARDADLASFTMVSHSFELLCRRRERINRILRRRFEKLCAGIEALDGVDTATYADHPPAVAHVASPWPSLPFNRLRTGHRLMEQAAVNALYGT